jgi:hypothetical protein
MFFSKKPGRPFQLAGRMLILAFLAAALSAGPAQGKVLFGPPLTLAAGDVDEPQIAVDPQGRVTVVWAQLGPEKLISIRAARLNPGGFPESTQTLAEFPTAIPHCYCPQVVVDSSGRATVAWQGVVAGHRRIQAAQIDPSGTAGPVHTLSADGEEGWHQQLTVDGQGRVTVAWETTGASNIEAARFGADGALEEVKVLAEAVPGLEPVALAASPPGEVTVAWPTSAGLQVVQLGSTGAPGPIRSIPSTDNADGVVDVVADSSGRATLAWWRGSGINQVRSVSLDPEGNPGAVRTLSPTNEGAFEPRLAVDSQGRVTATWVGVNERVYAARLDEGGSPLSIHLISEPAHRAGPPRIASGTDGTTTIAWSHPPDLFARDEGCLPNAEFDYESDAVKAAFLGPDGSPVQLENVSPFGEQAGGVAVAVDPQGQPIVAWESFDGTYFCEDTTTRIQVSRGLTAVDPQPGPPPSPAPPSPGVEQRGKLRLARRAAAADGRLVIKVTCPQGGGVCAGRLEMSASKLTVSRRLEVSPHGLPKTGSRVSIARGSFWLDPGKRKKLALSLTGWGRRLVKDSSGQLLRLVGMGRGVEGGTVLVRQRPLGEPRRGR